MQISKYFIKTLAAFALMSPVACSMGGGSDQSALSGQNGSGDDDDCTYTQGYWKNHPDAWPVSSLKLGSVTYTKAELIAILKTPVKGNGLIQLAHQLIAAKLNIAAGASDADIKVTIQAADALIGSLVVGEAELPTSQTSALNDKLDAFNNGKIGPGHCDDKDDDDDDDDCDHDDDGDCDGDDDDCDHDDDGDCDGDTAVCGNGVKEGAEGCDDGNTTNGDGCSSTCTIETHECVCGDGIKDVTEACDDGNTVSGDGCSSTCTIELPVCGDGVKAVTEACDDGNTVNGDGCSSTCTIELPVCGNGVVETGETCDDGNTNNGDGCSSVCICEPCH